MGLLKGNNAPYDTFLFRSAARPNFQAMGRLHFHIDAFWAVPEGFFCRWFADVEGDSRRLRGLDYVQLEGGLIARNELFTHWLAAASAHHA